MYISGRFGRLLGSAVNNIACARVRAPRDLISVRRLLLLSVLALLGVCSVPSDARTVPVHLPFERVMRDVQLRYEYFHTGTITWPGCCFGSGSSSPGAYPADGYYGDYVSRPCAIRMTQALVDGLRAAVSSPGVWLHEDCWNIEGKAPQDVNDPNSGPVFHFLTAEDLRIPSSVTVDATNYMYWFSVVQSGVQKLSHTYHEVGQSNIAGAHGVGSSNNQADCDTARTAAKGLAESDWNTNAWSDPAMSGFVMQETLGTAETSHGVWKADVQLINNRGKLTCNLSSQPADLVSGCTATIYLALGHFQDGESNYPPVATDRKFHLYDTHSGLSDYESATTLAGTRTVLTIPCEASCATPPDTGFLVCKEKGWFRISQTAILALEFDHDPSTSTACTGQRPAIPPIRTTTGSSTAGNHGDKGPTNCSGQGSVRAGPSTSNSPGGRDGGGSGGSGKRPEGGRPVDLATGAKIERALDISVQLPGTVFQVYRGYCSDPALDEGNGLMGARWSLSIFTRLQVGSTNIELVGSTLKDNLVFAPTTSGHWSASGPTTQELISTTATISGDTVNVYRLTEPGHWYMDFFRDAGIKQGLLAQEVDVYGNKQTYAYTAYVDSTNTSIDTPRLTAIYLNGQSATDCVAEVLLDWILPALEGDPTVPSTSLGKLASIASYRFDAQRHPILLKGVTYLYKADGDDLNADLGTAGDLIQVTSSERVDSSPFLPFYTTVTQYRYHTVSLTHSSGDERIALVGGSHQLKHVVQPEQIEFVAQLLNVGNTPASDTAVTGTAATLLTLADTATVLTGTSYINLPAKIIGYSSNKVSVQYVQTSCGCSGGTQGTRESYSYFSSSTLPSTKVTEAVWGGSAFTDYRINYYDMKVYSGVPYLFTYAIQDANDSSKLWAWHYLYDSTNQNLIKMMLPSACDSYTPAGTSAASYAEKSGAGLVYGWAYTSDNRLTESRLAKGNVSTDPSISGFTILSKATFQSGSGARTWLPAQIDVYRTESGSTSPDDLETTTLSYGLHSGDAVAWIKTSVERELVAENGPGSGTYDSFELFDTKGQNTWSCSTDLTLTRRVFDASTGAITSITRNASSSELGSSYAGQSTTGWGPSASSDGSLTTTYTNDLLGRMTSRTSPGGVSSYTIRVMREDSDTERKGVLSYAQIALPHQLAGTTTFDGPMTVTWYNAGNQVIRSSDYALDGSAAYAPLSFVYTPGSEMAKSTTQHYLSGLVQYRRTWQDVSTSPRSPAYSTTSYSYDSMGRVSTITSPTGTISQNAAFDVLGRVLEVTVGTNAGTTGNDMATVAKYYYDSGGAESQGVGDGYLTCESQYTGEDGTASENQHRNTKRTFDVRGRMFKVERPRAPHEYVEYDNVDRPIKRGLYSSVPSAIGGNTDTTRGLYSEFCYSQRGLLYKQRVAINAADIGNTSTSNGFLESNLWFDSEGRTVAEWAPNAPETKRTFDAHGRTRVLYVTDRRDDNAPGSSGNYAHALAHDDDSVLEQTEYTYDGSSSAWPDCLTLVKTFRRNHDADTYTSKRYGTLDADNSVATYVGYFYDAALRRTHTVDFGTNTATGSTNDLFKNGSTPTWPPSPLAPPSFGEEKLVSAVEFNARGLVARSIDPKQHATEYRFDDMSRRIALIENAQGTTGSFSIGWNSTTSQWTVSGLNSTTPDQNRVTSFVYDEAGNVIKQIAHTSDSTSQVTQYNYTTSKDAVSTDTNSLLGTKSLLGEVLYPKEDTGQPDTNPSTNATLRVRYAYNRQGELRSVVDQNNTKHTYSRDEVGHVLTDTPTVPSSGSNINTTIKRIGVSYDDFGRLATVRSYDNLSTSNVRNAVEFLYTSLWQVEHLFQNVKGDISRSGTSPSGDTKKVQYGYTNSVAPTSGTGAANFSRVTSMKYPSTNQITYGYASGVDDRISRLTSITPGTGTDKDAIVEYSRLGLDMIAVVDYPLADVQLDRTFSHDGKRRPGFNTQDKGVYPGWDRHGRVRIQAWVDGNLTAVTSGDGNGYPNRPPLFEEGYSYDAASNRTGKDDIRPGVKWTNPDSRYSYDGLDRLTETKKNLRTATTFDAQKGSQRWELDVLGNWTKFQKELNGYTSGSPYTNSGETEDRTHNQANEILNRYPNGTGNTPTLPFTYDHAGNLREEQFNSTTSNVFTHDAWNRLVKHEFGGTMIALNTNEYEYNGLHWRTISRQPPTELSEEPTGGVLRSMYYSAAWQLVEENIDNDYLSGATIDRVAQEVWGIRYIDDPVMRLNGSSISTATEYYHLTDVQFSTVAMTGIGADPEIKERVRYDAYGTATHRSGFDVNDDGPVNSSDASALNSLIGKHIYDADYNVAMDLNRDGQISKLDDALLSAAGTIAAMGAGEMSDRSTTGPDNVFGYEGYVFAPELQRYCVRFRWYDPPMGRWMERDREGYVDGANLFEFVSGKPLTSSDAYGLTANGQATSPPIPVFGIMAPISKCRVALTCHRVIRFGVGVGTHCGLIVDTGFMRYEIHGTGGDTNWLAVTPSAAKPKQAFVTMSNDTCRCLLTRPILWNAYFAPPRDHITYNSNWNLKCELKDCAADTAALWGKRSKPIGYGSKQIKCTKRFTTCVEWKCRECDGEAWELCNFGEGAPGCAK